MLFAVFFSLLLDVNLSREIIKLQSPHSLSFSYLLQHTGSYDRITCVLSQACCVTSVPGISSVLFFILPFWKCFCCAARSSAWFCMLFVVKHPHIGKVVLIKDLWQSGLISALSFSTYLICLVTACLWVLQHKHHSQFGNVLRWHSPKAPHVPESIISHFCNFFVFHSCVAPKASCYILDFILPLTLCSVWFRQHPDGLFLKWACSGKSLTVVTHQRMRLTWKDWAQHRRLFSIHWHLGVTWLYTAYMCVYVCARVYSLYMWRSTHTNEHYRGVNRVLVIAFCSEQADHVFRLCLLIWNILSIFSIFYWFLMEPTIF